MSRWSTWATRVAGRWQLTLAGLLGLAWTVALVKLRPGTPGSPAEAMLLLALDGRGPVPDVGPWHRAVAGLIGFLPSHFVGLQAAALVAAGVAVAAVAVLVRQLNGTIGSVWLGAVVMASWPGLVVHALTAEGAAAAAALTAVAALALMVADTRPGLWPLAGVAVGLAASCGLPSLVALAPLMTWAVMRAVARRGVGSLALAAAVAAATAGLTWALARVLLGGGAVAAVPEVSVVPVSRLQAWLLDAPGGVVPACLVVVLAGLGGVAWWRSGQRDVALLGLTGAAGSLLAAALTRPVTEAVTGFLPAVVWLAVLVGGVGLPSGKRLRLAVVVGMGAWGLAAWGAAWPALASHREAPPAWRTVEWLREHGLAERTTVVSSPDLEPFARLLLEPAGFLLSDATSAIQDLESGGRGRVFYLLAPRADPGGEIAFASRLRAGREQRLAAPALAGAILTRFVAGDGAVVSLEWDTTSDPWRLSGTGTITLPLPSGPRAAVIAVRDGEVELVRAGGWRRRLGAGTSLRVPIWPGAGGQLQVQALGDGKARVAKVVLSPLQPDDAAGELGTVVVVPQVASAPGVGNAYWRTDLMICTLQTSALPLEGYFLPTGRANREAAVVRGDVPAGGCLQLPDVLQLPALKEQPRVGALILRPREGASCPDGACRFKVLSRTFNSRGASSDPGAEALPGVPAEQGLRPGQWARLGPVRQSGSFRTTVGLASWADGPVTVRLVVHDQGGKEVGRTTETIPPWGHRQIRLPVEVFRGEVRVDVLDGPSPTLVFPYISVVDGKRQAPVNSLASATGGSTVPRPLPRLPRELRPAKGPGGAPG